MPRDRKSSDISLLAAVLLPCLTFGVLAAAGCGRDAPPPPPADEAPADPPAINRGGGAPVGSS